MKMRLGEEPPAIVKKKRKTITTLDNFAEIYFKEKELEVKDIEKIKKSYINHIKQFLGHRDVDEITSGDIKEVQKFKRNVLAERTVNALIQIIGAIYNVAIQKDLFKGNNPVNKSIKRVNVDNKRERYLTLEEINILLNEVKNDDFLYVVPDFRLNKAFDRLNTLPDLQKNKVEFLCNECCFFGCMDRKRCYEAVSLNNLGKDCPDHRCNAPDVKTGYRFSKAMTNPGFIGIDDIQNIYLPMGFSNFKIEGRGLGSALILEFLLYYMTKPQYQLHVREEIYLDNMLDLF